LIQDSVRKVDSGSELVNRSGQTLGEIVQSIKRVTDIVAEIAATMQMDQVTQSNASQTEEMASTAQGLSSSAEQLQALVGSFQLGTQAAAPSARPSAAAVRMAPVARKKAAPTATRSRAVHDSRTAQDSKDEQPALAALALHTGGSNEDEFEEF
jgi:methyl-accepting chemotaxis protein